MPTVRPVLAGVHQLRPGDRFLHHGAAWKVDRVLADPDMPALLTIQTVEGPRLEFCGLDIVWLVD